MVISKGCSSNLLFCAVVKAHRNLTRARRITKPKSIFDVLFELFQVTTFMKSVLAKYTDSQRSEDVSIHFVNFNYSSRVIYVLVWSNFDCNKNHTNLYVHFLRRPFEILEIWRSGDQQPHKYSSSNSLCLLLWCFFHVVRHSAVALVDLHRLFVREVFQNNPSFLCRI